MADRATVPPEDDRIAAALARTLEEATFVFAERTAAPPPFEGALLEARLRWTGPDACELRLVTTPALAGALAANLLGVDEAQDRGPDALGELLNMVAGAVAVDRYGPREAPRLLLPSVGPVNALAHGRRSAAATVAVSLVDEEERRIDVTLAPAVGAAP